MVVLLLARGVPLGREGRLQRLLQPLVRRAVRRPVAGLEGRLAVGERLLRLLQRLLQSRPVLLHVVRPLVAQRLVVLRQLVAHVANSTLRQKTARFAGQFFYWTFILRGVDSGCDHDRLEICRQLIAHTW